MYINKCTQCGAEFETKNPKRVICPNCLYPEKKEGDAPSEAPKSYSSYQPEDLNKEQRRPANNFTRRPQGDNRGNNNFRRNNGNNKQKIFIFISSL